MAPWPSASSWETKCLVFDNGRTEWSVTPATWTRLFRTSSCEYLGRFDASVSTVRFSTGYTKSLPTRRRISCDLELGTIEERPSSLSIAISRIKRIALRIGASLDRALGSLSQITRIAIVLRYVEENTFPEIARELSLGESAVKMRVRRGLKRLQKNPRARGYASRPEGGLAARCKRVSRTASAFSTQSRRCWLDRRTECGRL